MATPDEIFDDASGDIAIGDLASAAEKYRRCVELDPDFFDGWHALGMALMKLGRFEEAIGAGKRAVELRPNDQIGWTSLSLFYNRAGNIKEAEAAGTKAKIISWGGKVAKEYAASLFCFHRVRADYARFVARQQFTFAFRFNETVGV